MNTSQKSTIISWLKGQDFKSTEPSSDRSNTHVENEENNKWTLALLLNSIQTALLVLASVRKRQQGSTIQNYLSLGFTYTGKEEEPRPRCVVCCEMLSNESMKPAHLRQHFTMKHAILKDKPLDFFRTGTRKIIYMADDVRSMLIERIKMSRWVSLQLDDSTDVADLHVYIRYEFEGMFHEDFLFCKLLPNKNYRGAYFSSELVIKGQRLMGLFEVQMFLHDQKSPLASLFDDPVWLVQLAYLADIFSRLNELNMGLQGLSLRIFDVSDKITAMKKKLQLFVIKIKAGNVSAFPTLENHLHTDYPALSLKAVRFLMPFATTYLCEKGFSALTAIKTKYRNKMNVEPDMRLKLTSLVPDIARLS
ncbi:F200A protein, partial [Amia calva]|nr:F200A protein [Amia calva]